MAPLPTHHPGDHLLLEYASGAQREPVALLVATHLALCPRCRRQAGALEALGGALVEQLGPDPVSEGALARLLDRLDDKPDAAAAPERAEPGPKHEPTLPRPLCDYAGGAPGRLRWRRFGPIAEARLLPDRDGFRARLMRLRAGAAAPPHTHEGTELALVLAGGFKDAFGHYLRGDVEEADSAVEHRPVADADQDCLCLVVTDAPLRLTGLLGRLTNPWRRLWS